MLHLNQIKKIILPGIIGASALLTSAASMADPVILPPDRNDLVAVPPVFCFKVTGGDNMAGGGARIQFEVLNWTGEAASQVRITQSTNLAANTGGYFNTLSTVNQPNGWHANPTFGGEIPNSITFMNDPDPYFGFGLTNSVQNPIQGFDLDMNNDLNFDDPQGSLPNPVDSGNNVLDGFILEFPEFDVFERVVLQWDLLNEFGQNVDSDFVLNPFSFGTFQIDRAANGSIRVATYFSIGTDLYDLPANIAPLDQVLTEANAITLAPTSAVPVPAAAWLMLSGLVGLVGVARKRGKKTV